MDASGCKQVPGMWIEQTEGAKFWLRVMNELRSRGTQEILIAVVDGLKGFPEATTAVFPDTVVQLRLNVPRRAKRRVPQRLRQPLAAPAVLYGAYIERFNRRYREEVLSAYVYESLEHVRALTDEWLQTYNEERPHDSLGRVPPLTFMPRPNRPVESGYRVST